MQGSLSLGNPVCNKSFYKDALIEYNLDAILAIEEFIYLKDHLGNTPKKIVEVGAGFGRTAQVLLTGFSSIEKYYIYDLPQTLQVSKTYLFEVLNQELFDKLVFVTSLKDYESSYDVSIQINALQEIPEEEIQKLYTYFFERSNYVYLKNPIAKYLPVHAGLDVKMEEVPLDVGRSLEIVDVWNLSELEGHYHSHIERYQPRTHHLINWSPERLFPHFCHSLYKNHS